jgi:acylphosphatase
MHRVHLIVSGRVQGVFFRQHTVERARGLGLTGWVKNCRDGTVEVMAEGKQEQLQKLVDWCHRGPRGAVVTKVQVAWEPGKGEFDDFDVAW